VDHLLVYVLHGLLGSEMGEFALGRITYIHVVASHMFGIPEIHFKM
jgi:ribosomal protein S19